MASPTIVTVDCKTGKTDTRPMTAPETTALNSAQTDATTKATAEAATRAELDDMKGRAAQVLAKARAIIADPVNAPDWTAGERKVILAALVVDKANR